MKNLYLITLFLFGALNIAYSQNRASCILGDTLRLQIDEYRGELSWEESSDSLNWVDLPGSIAELAILPSIDGKWLRLKVQEENCPEFYEFPFWIEAVDTTSNEFTRGHLSIEDIEGTLLSQGEHGVLEIEMGTNPFPLSAGDYLKGFDEQQTMLLIDLIIVQQGIATVYTSQSNLNVYDLPLSFGETITGMVRGLVVDQSGNGVFGAKVKIGIDSIYTDVKGVFQFNSAQMYEQFGYLVVSKDGYFNGSRSFVPIEGGNELLISLLKAQSVGFFNESVGITVDYGSFQVQIEPNSVTLNGSLYTGFVRLRMQEINPDSANFEQIMPGALIGNQFGNIRSLLSLGMFAIELVSNTGQKLEILENQPVTISYSLSPEVEQFAPDTIDLWSFDEEFGYWIKEGKAFKVDGKYVSEFSHFSFWNYDIPFPTAYFHGTVVDLNGNPVAGAAINLSFQGGFTSQGQTNYLGNFGGLVPKNNELTLQVSYTLLDDEEFVSESIIIPAIQTDTVYQIITVSINENFSFVIGNAVNCDGLPLVNGYLIHNNSIVYINNGQFEFYSNPSLDSIKLVGANPTILGQWYTFNSNVGLNNLGTIQLCNGDTFFTGTVVDFDQNVYNTVLIGDIWWMSENLRTTHFSNGEEISLSIAASTWFQASSSSYCSYNNNPADANIYGFLYNGYSISDSNNVCPLGWHVPSSNEYLQTEYFLGMHPDDLFPSVIGSNYFRGAYANLGGRLKSINYWQEPNNGATNEIGFSAVPNGFRSSIDGTFGNRGLYGNYWLFNGFANGYLMSASFSQGYNETGLYYSGSGIISLKAGRSVRCIRND